METLQGLGQALLLESGLFSKDHVSWDSDHLDPHPAAHHHLIPHELVPRRFPHLAACRRVYSQSGLTLRQTSAG